MKPANALLASGLLLAICVVTLFAVHRRTRRDLAVQATASHIHWAYKAGAGALSGIALAPDGTIHFAAADGVYALSRDGQLLWKTPLPSGPVVAAPSIGPDGTLYAASQSGRLFAVSFSGNPMWESVTTQHRLLTPPALGEGQALYVTDDYSDLFAFAPGLDTNLRWKLMTYGPAAEEDGVLLGNNPYGDGWWRTSPIIDPDGMIYLAHQDWLYQISPGGEILWFIQLPAGQLDFPAIGGDGTIYVEGHNPPWLFAVGRDGKRRWVSRVSSRVMGSPVIDNAGLLYFCDSDFVKALTPDGQQKWSFLAPCNSGPALASDGTLYLGINGPRPMTGPPQFNFAAVSSDGQLKWEIEIHGAVLDAPAIAPDGTIFFTTDQGYAYSVFDTDASPMDSPWPRFQHDAQNSGRLASYH